MNESRESTVDLTPFQSLMWLYHQTLVPTACPCGRINLIGGLILWELSRRGKLDFPCVPRLALYGVSRIKRHQAAAAVGRLAKMPVREGSVRVSRRRGGHCDGDEILLMETPAFAPHNMEEDRHRFILFAGETDPHAWHRQTFQARRVLPIRVSDGVSPAESVLVPNPIKLVCDEWLRRGKPELHMGTWTWPCETTDWRSTVEDVLLASGWPWLPRTITTVDDL